MKALRIVGGVIALIVIVLAAVVTQELRLGLPLHSCQSRQRPYPTPQDAGL
jgi:hypothetical protein